MLDSVPWAVAGPEHKAESARSILYEATAGAEGVSGTGDFKVAAQPVPDGSVRVMPGGALMPNVYAGATAESYGLRNPTASTVAITATGSGGGRSDAVIARVLDPQYEGSPPADPNAFEYARLAVIEGVSPSLEYAEDLAADRGLTYPFLLLARVDLAPSTGTVYDDDIVDLREIVAGQERTVTRTYAQLATDEVQALTSQIAYPQGQYFPRLGGSGAPDNSTVHTIRVPRWATEMEVRAEWLSVAAMEFSGNGSMWVTWDTEVASDPRWFSQAFRWSSLASSHRQTWLVVDTAPVHEDARGRDLHFALRAKRDDGNGAGEILMDEESGLVLSVRFMQRPD